MRPGRLLAAVVAVACHAAFSAGPAGAEPVPPAEPLANEGRWIVDDRGRVVVLHGANVVAKGEPALPADRGFGADDADFLAANGFNTVRLGVDFSAIEPSPGDYDGAFIDAWVEQVPMLAERGIFTLLDLHQDQFARKYNGNGLPNWMGLDEGILPNTGEPFPTGYLQNPALNRAFDQFWANADPGDGTGIQEHYAEGLRRVAAAAADQPGLLGYDVFNEPWPGSLYPTCVSPAGCPLFDAITLTDFSKRAIAAIRQEDSTHLAFYEPNVIFDFGAHSLHGDTGDERAGFSFHNYCLPGQFVPGTIDQSCGLLERTVMTNAEIQSTRTGDALLMTEFGATDDAATLRRLAALADESMVGWHVWTYANYYNGGQGAGQSLVLDTTKPPEGDNVKTASLEALARPYPRLVAGTPQGWSFDPGTRRFEASWKPELVGGGNAGALLSEIFVPALHYGSGYRVRAQGGEIVGGAGSQHVRVRNCPGAQTVDIVVEPGGGPAPRTCSEQGGGGGGPGDPPPPGGEEVACPPGNSPTVRCARTTLPNGRRVLQIVGTAAGEQLAGSPGRDVIVCGSGDDVARGRDGADLVRCGTGDDEVRGGGRGDSVFGGGGADLVRGGKGADTLIGNQGRDDLRGGPGADGLRLLAGGGQARGGDGPDRLEGGSGRDLLRAGSGADLLRARSGRRDELHCGPGLDAYRADPHDSIAGSCE